MCWNRSYSKPNLHSINTCYAASGRLSRQPNGHAPELNGKYNAINGAPDYCMPNTINPACGYPPQGQAKCI